MTAPRPWATIPVTGAQHAAWMAERGPDLKPWQHTTLWIGSMKGHADWADAWWDVVLANQDTAPDFPWVKLLLQQRGSEILGIDYGQRDQLREFCRWLEGKVPDMRCPLHIDSTTQTNSAYRDAAGNFPD